MDKINFYKKAVDKYFEKCKWMSFIYKMGSFHYGAFFMLGAIMAIDYDLEIEEMKTIYNYFDELQHNAEN